MQLPLYTTMGAEHGTMEVPEAVFGARWNATLVKQVVDGESANRRQSIAHTKIRSEVRGGGKKPWKQKGTGRARQGSTRSPLWKGGGTTFGPRNEKSYEKHINKKMRRAALFAVLSAKVRDGELFCVDGLTVPEAKTKHAAKIFAAFPKLTGKSVLFVSAGDRIVERAVRNLDRVMLTRASDLNALDLLAKSRVVMPREAVSTIVQTFLKTAAPKKAAMPTTKHAVEKATPKKVSAPRTVKKPVSAR